MFDYLGRLAVARPWRVCLGWLLLGAALSAVAPSWQAQAQDDDVRFLPANDPSVRGYRLLADAFPKDVFASRAIFALERPDAPLTAADFALADRLVGRLDRLRREEPDLKIAGVGSYREPLVGDRLTGRDRRCTLITLSLGTPYLALQTRHSVDRAEAALREVVTAAGPDAPALFVTGPAGVGRDLVRASAESLDHTTIATIVLVVVVLLLVYRSPLLALIPLLTVAASAWVSLSLLALATLIPGVQLVNIAQVFAVVILFGAGTDYCLFLIARYREELEAGQTGPVGLHNAVRAVGGALAASAGTVIVGLGMMGFAEFGKIRCAGPVIAVGLAVALAASLTLTPAMLRIIGKAAFWPVAVRVRTPGRRATGFWHSVSALVLRRPAAVWAAALLPLLALTVVGVRVQPAFKPTGDLSPTSSSVLGLEALQRHFTAGETGPLTVLLESPTDWRGPQGRELIAHLSLGFGFLPNVAEVRSLTQPLGERVAGGVEPGAGPPPATGSLLHALKRRAADAVEAAARARAEAHYVAAANGKSVTRIDVVMKADPFDKSSVETLGQIETWLRELLPRRASVVGEVRAECFGVTAQTRDLAAVVGRDRRLVNGLVLAGVFLILLVLVRRLWLAGYLLGTVLLSYYATLGATAVMSWWLLGKPLNAIEWRVPFFLFTILVAVGEDYNILLVTRVLQEKKRHGVREGVRRGLAHTGGTITACGLIMAGTFGTLMLADLGTLIQVGFALAVGVLLDTLVVRPLLVPAFLLMVWGDRRPAARGVPLGPLRAVAVRRLI